MSWTQHYHEASASNPKVTLHRLELNRLDPKAWVTIYLYEQLEGENFRKGKRFWFTVSDPVKTTSNFFGGSLEKAKQKALKCAVENLEKFIKGLARTLKLARKECDGTVKIKTNKHAASEEKMDFWDLAAAADRRREENMDIMR